MTPSQIDLLQGTLDMLVLRVLESGEPMHGYAVARRIQEVTDDALRVEEGSLYPALHRLARKRWVRAKWGTSENNRRAKFYVITRTGRARLAEERSTWARLSEAVDRVLQTA